MSRPAQNTSPLPRITTTRSSAATGACNASIMLEISSVSSALRFSGRFIHTVFTGPFFSMMTLLMTVTPANSLWFYARGLDLVGPPLGLGLHVGREVVEADHGGFHAALRHGLHG